MEDLDETALRAHGRVDGLARSRATSGAHSVVRTAIIPQPMSIPPAAGMAARLVGITLPMVAPFPACTSGVTAAQRWMKGMRATRRGCSRASSSEGTPAVQGQVGTPQEMSSMSWMPSGVVMVSSFRADR